MSNACNMECNKTASDLYNNNNSCSTNTSDTDDREFVHPAFVVSVGNIIVAIVLIFIDVITIFGNLLVIISFCIDKRLSNPFNLLILNLAFTDFIVAITAMIFYTIDTLLKYWPFGGAMCAVWIYFDFGTTFASVLTVVAIAVHRLWSVMWAMQYRTQNNWRKNCIIIATIWVCVIAIWTPPFIFDRSKHRGSHSCIWEPSENTEFVIFVAIIGHYVPCIIMVFSYAIVFLEMRHRAMILAPTILSVSRMRLNHHLQSNESSSSGVFDRTNAPINLVKRTQPEIKHLDPNLYKDTACNNSSTIHVTPSLALENSVSSTRTSVNKNNKNMVTLSNQTTCHKREKRTFMTTYVVACYLICWFPFYIVFDIYAWRPELVPAGLYTIFFWMTYLNSTLNPFIYVFTNKDFRSACIKVINCLARRGNKAC